MARREKEGQITKVFSYLLYFIAVVVTLVVINVPSCFGWSFRASGNIGGDLERAFDVKAESQLSSMLRTAVPDKAELFEGLDWLQARNRDGLGFAGDFDSSAVTDIKDFLISHPEVYAGRDFSGFIAALHVIHSSTGSNTEKQRVRQTFKAVSASLFLRRLPDYPKQGRVTFYVLPLAVDFENSDKGYPGKLVTGANGFRVSLCSYSQYDLCVQHIPQDIGPNRDIARAVQLVPLADLTTAKAEFWYYPEVLAWLPEP